MPDHHYITIDGQFCVLHPKPLYEAALQLGTTREFWGKANSITVPIGMQPGSAWLLLTRSCVDALDKNALHTMTWTWDRGGAATTQNFTLWTLHSAKCIGIDGDEQAAYLIELRDRRELLAKGAEVNRAYNLTVPRDPVDSTGYRACVPGTLNAGQQWTWQEVLEDLWGELDVALAGTCPGLTWVPSHDPHNLTFYGMQAWEAIGIILEACHCALVPTLPGPFTLVDLGSAQAGLAAAWTALTTELVFDAKPKVDLQSARCPETIRVLFPRRYWDAYTKPPAQWWERGYAHEVGIASEIANAEGELIIWSDLPAEVSNTGTILNAAACGTSAASMAAKVSARINVQSDSLGKTYAGLRMAPTLGSQVHSITWRDYGDAAGMVTDFRSIWDWRLPQQTTFRQITKLRDVPPGCYVALTPQGGIPARAGATVGSAACDLYYIDATDGLVAWLDEDDNQITEIVKNSSTTAIEEDIYIPVKQELRTGRFLAQPEGSTPDPATVKEALATLEQDMCPDDVSGAVENVEMLDSVVAAPTDADNIFNLSGKAGSWVKLKYRPSTETWFIEQVEHVMRTIALEDPQTETFILYSEAGQADCQLDGYVLEKASVMSCEDPGWKIQIPMTTRSYVAGIRYENCAIEADYQGFCAFGSAGEAAWAAAITLYERTVITDLDFDSGENGCTLTADIQTVCLFEDAGAPSETPVITFDIETVLLDVDFVADENGCAVAGTAMDICTIAVSEPTPVSLVTLNRRKIVTDIRYQSTVNGCAIQANVQLVCLFEAAGEANWQDAITLVRRTLVAEVAAPEGESCPSLTVRETEVCLFDADDEQEGDTILQWQIVELLTDIQVDNGANGCAIQAKTQSICTLAVGEPSEWMDIITLANVDVVTGFNEDESCVYAEFQTVCLVAVDAAVTDEPIICGVDCEDPPA